MMLLLAAAAAAVVWSIHLQLQVKNKRKKAVIN
jgi:hypothetical protein